ncbi:PREDICTED: hepatitis A virus cellular receptor 1-like [Hipposideros armiger]|uniref:Hepatitis A virus cellular receptor 1-like n=1 Tax=Hipposideros armiger TaxID=186990 RepID=A0A8B7S9H2_HIPAR|nr:PREDICTED: hepatitis A virus cellular receptor 1-like [Hipposideros armiger]
MIPTEALCIGISIPIVLLLTVLTAIIIKKYLCTRGKALQMRKLSSSEPQTGTLQNANTVRYRAEESIYFENKLYNMHSDPVAL